jgi:hypothetical protein
MRETGSMVPALSERALQRRLYRFACPSPHALGDYEFGLVGAETRTGITAHLVDCPRCRDELDDLRAFLAAEPAPASPGIAGRLRRAVANLLAPPEPAFAGLRGGVDAALLAYGTADVRITLHWEGQQGKATLIGLLWREGADAEAELAGTATLIAGDRPALAVAIDELGNFAFEEVTAGPHRLELALADQVIVIPELTGSP